MSTELSLPSGTFTGRKSITIELSADTHAKLLEVCAMCIQSPSEHIEEAIRSTLSDAYEEGPSFVLSCLTWSRDEIHAVSKNARRFLMRNLPDMAADSLKQFHPVPIENEPGRWGVETLLETAQNLMKSQRN